jgi:hypothetical protein
MRFKQISRCRANLMQRGPSFGFLACLDGFARQVDACLLRQLLDGLAKSKILNSHGEADNVTVCATAEAMVEALSVYHIETRSFFIVKGAKPYVVPSPLLQSHEPCRDPGQRETMADFLKNLRWIGHRFELYRLSRNSRTGNQGLDRAANAAGALTASGAAATVPL